ncbi:hypothetical protein BDM02DRAFT_3090893 [Thelephora ganbajun]|uniref:Uncharacterized protein n=1 Tax=Thelephora ganbajun TaxID=370292 RepID=A0ACB6ZQC6_THEGA|nr:hypothetical protein BDM02DRAFT_3090893 [Thelephora ganbajun]
MHQVPETQEEEGKAGEGSNHLSSDFKSAELNIEDESEAAGDFITTRHRHETDEYGNHVVIGREGDIRRCEDEPIRTPGAIQGFGVMIVVAENAYAGTLAVRQVSENSTDVLGLSPRYLFSLKCFTDVLSDSQADLLWDSVQFVDKSWSPEEKGDYSPHMITITGWGQPGSDDTSNDSERRKTWKAWCAVHRPKMPENTDQLPLIVLEFELESDDMNPLYPPQPESLLLGPPVSGNTGSGSTTTEISLDSHTQSLRTNCGMTARSAGSADILPEIHGLDGDYEWQPSPQDVLESTASRSKPLKALQRLHKFEVLHDPASGRGTVDSDENPSPMRRKGRIRRRRSAGGVSMMDVFAVMSQINEQFGNAPDLKTFLDVVVGVVKELTQFHRVLVYQFDEVWNGFVTAELVDWSKTHDLFKGLHFPASDIPPQAGASNHKVRLLYDRDQPTARLVVKSKDDLEPPLDMTHCFLRAMSPIHLKYLGNMGVRASMSVSITAFGQLWGLVACHSYGYHGMRVPFPIRRMLCVIGQSISKNIERLSYAQRLHTRKLINTMPSDQHPSGYIVSNADDLLELFDADYGVLVIGEGAKILGPNEHSQEILVVAEYLRLKRFTMLQVSQAVTADFPDLQLPTGLEVIAGLLLVPLSGGGRDFIVFLRKGQQKKVRWAGKPFKGDAESTAALEPRKSFKVWSETTTGKCRRWADEQLETAGVLALVYGKFIEVWRQKESALQTTKLANILLSNASHEGRTPLNHIINYLELALNGPLDRETRENLNQSHAASKSLLFTINDLLDLTRLESGQDTSFNEPFDLHHTIEEATHIYRNEARRRNLQFAFEVSGPRVVVGDSRKIRTVVANLTANALKYSTHGKVTVECKAFEEPEGLRREGSTAVEIVVADTGCGISPTKLESIFREFEQVESAAPRTATPGLGLGLAVVARIVQQLGGQLRVESKMNEGSRFSFLIPFAIARGVASRSCSTSSHVGPGSRKSSSVSDIDDLVEALASDRVDPVVAALGHPYGETPATAVTERRPEGNAVSIPPRMSRNTSGKKPTRLRVLIVEDNAINSKILGKRMLMDGHTVVYAANGQECVDIIRTDHEFDCILMDIQMPLLNGYEATERVRGLEKDFEPPHKPSRQLNGRIPIFAVSASLLEEKRREIVNFGIDGWILKPIDFKRLRSILRGIMDPTQRQKDLYREGRSWELGGWLR